MAPIDHKYARGIRIELKAMREAYEHDKARLEALLAEAERNCHHGEHRFGPTEYVPIHHEGFRDEGDLPGTMGIDWRGPSYVPSWDDPRWRRVCQDCGREEFTAYSVEHTQKKREPVWTKKGE